MPETQHDCKGISNPAKILRGYIEATGISDARILSERLEIPLRTIQRLKLEVASAVEDASAKHAIYGASDAPKTPNAPYVASPKTPDMAFSAPDPSRAHANKELPSEVSLFNRQTDSRSREVSQSVNAPPAELKQAFNGSTENLLADIQRWMNADRQHAVKWLTTLLSIAGSDAVLAAYGQLLESQTKGKLIADPIRYLGKTAPTLKGKQPATELAPLMIDGKPFKVTGVRYAKPRDEVANA